MNIGAGRVVLQDDVRLDRAMQDGSFYDNEVLRRTISDAKRRKASLHLLALLQLALALAPARPLLALAYQHPAPAARQPALQAVEVLEHPGARPVRVDAVPEDDEPV